MNQEKPVIAQLKNSGKYTVYILSGILLLVWLIETPAGVLGKADAIGYAVCHRIDLRSFHVNLRQLPLCARCTGQYVGAMVGLLFQGIFSRRRVGFPSRWMLGILGVFGLAYVVDGVNSYLSLPMIVNNFPDIPHLYEPTNTLRLLTGTGVGLAIAMLLYPAFVGSIYAQVDLRPSIAGLRPMLGLIGLGITADLLILSGSSTILYPAALISASGVIILLTLAYTTAILRIFNKENRYTRLSQISLPMAVGFLTAMSQIAILDLLRFVVTGSWSGALFG
jgi:uncharacterized membrane protein